MADRSWRCTWSQVKPTCGRATRIILVTLSRLVNWRQLFVIVKPLRSVGTARGIIAKHTGGKPKFTDSDGLRRNENRPEATTSGLTSVTFLAVGAGADETRTRDLRRDRQEPT